jgi:hypothetical protein
VEGQTKEVPMSTTQTFDQHLAKCATCTRAHASRWLALCPVGQRLKDEALKLLTQIFS